MEISSFSTPPPTPLPKSAPSAARRSEATAVTASAAPASSMRNVNLGAFESIQQAMNNLPNTRADVVARGKALVASSIYPAAEIISKLAEVFVDDADAVAAD